MAGLPCGSHLCPPLYSLSLRVLTLLCMRFVRNAHLDFLNPMWDLFKKKGRYVYLFGLSLVILCCPLVIAYFSHSFLCCLVHQRVSDFTALYNHPESLFKFMLGRPASECLPQQVCGEAWGLVLLTNSRLCRCRWAGSHVILWHGLCCICFPLPRGSEKNPAILKYVHNVLSSL